MGQEVAQVERRVPEPEGVDVEHPHVERPVGADVDEQLLVVQVAVEQAAAADPARTDDDGGSAGRVLVEGPSRPTGSARW